MREAIIGKGKKSSGGQQYNYYTSTEVCYRGDYSWLVLAGWYYLYTWLGLNSN